MRNTKNIWCLAALARCGKSTAGKILEQELYIQQYALADPIKNIMCALFGWDDSHKDGAYKEIKMVYRVTPDRLEEAAELYYSYGLGEYEEFHDCWDKICRLLPINYDSEEMFTVISPREAFQLFGTDWGRSIDPEIWLKIAPTYNVIITDIRFDNEAEYFRNLGGKVIRIKRPGFGAAVQSHASEAGVSDSVVDATIINDTDLEDYEAKVRHCIKTLERM